MKIAYFDCFAGASGDMTLAALIDAGVEVEELKGELGKLDLPGYEIEVSKVKKHGITGTDVDVIVSDHVHERHLDDIEKLIDTSNLEEDIKLSSKKIFGRLAVAEANVHGTTPDKVHFHEVGGIDAIIDIVGSVIGLKLLGIEEIYTSSFPMSHGYVKSAHGIIPVPAPATMELIKGFPVYSIDIEGELLTPTGAAILTTLAKGAGMMPQMKLEGVGYGAGKKDFDIPNLLRIYVGMKQNTEGITDTVVLLETNIDDMNPEIYDHLSSRLFEASALDVYLTPIQMKKNRPAILLSILTSPQNADRLREIIFKETTTLGIREQVMRRQCLSREWKTVETPYGEVRLKIAKLGDRIMTIAPEYEDCKRLSLEKGVPIKSVYAVAEALGIELKDRGSM